MVLLGFFVRFDQFRKASKKLEYKIGENIYFL